jgi:hypothetical protein
MTNAFQSLSSSSSSSSSSRQFSTTAPNKGGKALQTGLEINKTIALFRKGQKAEKLLQYIMKERATFDAVNTKIAYSALAYISKHHKKIRQDQRLFTFLKDTVKNIKEDKEGFGTKTCANILHSIAVIDVNAANAQSIVDVVKKKGASIATKGKPQDVGEACWAFAKLGVNIPSLFATVEARGKLAVQEGYSTSVANTAFAFATLGLEAPNFFGAVAKRSQWLTEKGTLQEVIYIGWAAMTLGLLGRDESYDDLILKCWNKAMATELRNKLSVEALTQLHEIELCAQIEGTEEFKKSMLPIPQSMRKAINNAVSNSYNSSNRIPLEVSETATSIGFEHEIAIDVGEFGSQFLSIDLASTERKLAIQVLHGRHHYNSDGQPNGKTMMKKRLLQKLGWSDVRVIPHFEWVGLASENEKFSYLKKLLEP